MDKLGAADIGGKINGKWKVLITDSCHSGAITPEGADQQVPRINQTLLDLQKSLFSNHRQPRPRAELRER